MTAENNMLFSQVTAFIRNDAIEKVTLRLKELGVPGISVSCVKGYGEYKDFYCRDLMTNHARIEILVSAQRADEIAQAIMDVAYTGVEGDGIVAILPVAKIYKIRQRAEVSPD